jgi:hypothetical protein
MKETRVTKMINLFIGNLLSLLIPLSLCLPAGRQGERAGVRGACFSPKDNTRPDFVPKNILILLKGDVGRSR